MAAAGVEAGAGGRTGGDDNQFASGARTSLALSVTSGGGSGQLSILLLAIKMKHVCALHSIVKASFRPDRRVSSTELLPNIFGTGHASSRWCHHWYVILNVSSGVASVQPSIPPPSTEATLLPDG